MSTVAITQHETIERGIAEALDHLSLDRLIRGKLVAVKPKSLGRYFGRYCKQCLSQIHRINELSRQETIEWE